MTSALIVAAGKGTRMGQGIDKLFLEVAGRPVLAHTWERFENASSIDEIILVVREGMESSIARIRSDSGFKKPFRLTWGGKERQDSVWNGLQVVSPSAEIVAIHDAARPCTSASLIEATIKAARETGAAVAAQRVTDTIKSSDDGCVIDSHLNRSHLWSVQTPQCFRIEVIRRALSSVRERGLLVTDDTAACELIGQAVKLVSDDQPNPKVTVTRDLDYIDHLLRRRP